MFYDYRHDLSAGCGLLDGTGKLNLKANTAIGSSGRDLLSLSAR